MRRAIWPVAALLLAAGCSGSSAGSSSSSAAATTASGGPSGTSGGATSSGGTSGAAGTSGSASSGASSSGAASSGTTSGSAGSSGTASSGSSGTGGQAGISGLATNVYVSAVPDGGETTVPRDLSGRTIGAWVYEDGGFTQYPGTGQANGTYSVPNVPTGAPFYLEFSDPAQASHVFVLTSGAPDLGYVSAGRSNLVPLTQPTPVTFAVTGLAPFQASDYFEIVALSHGGVDFGGYLAWPDGGPAPAPGDTDLTGASLDWSQEGSFTPAAVDPAQGDVIYLEQARTTVADGGLTLDVIDRFAAVSTFAVTDGQPATLTAALAPVTADRSFSLTVDRAAADALAPQVASGAQYTDTTVDLGALPGAARYGFYASIPDLLYVDDTSAGLPDQPVYSAAYGDPYPAAWDVLGSMAVRYGIPLAVPGAPSTYTVTGGFGLDEVLPSLPATWAPTLSPPQQLRVNGQAASADLSGLGESPTVSWQPPATGSPAGYTVTLHRVGYDPSVGYFNTRRIVITTDASATSVVLPPALFTARSDRTYYLSVTAFAARGLDVARAPFKGGAGYATATALTHAVAP